MKSRFALGLLLLAALCLAEARTVRDAIDAQGCGTEVVSGLSRQLVRQLNCLRSGLFTDLNSLSRVSLSTAAAAVPYLQTSAASALQRAVNQRGVTMTINSALRTLPQQLMLYTWMLRKQCRITAAAQPGKSNHNGGLAVDIQDANSWKTAMTNNGWTKLGDWDPMHYDYNGGTDVRQLSVLAFQKLWNLNNPNNKLTEDGAYGSKTENAILSSPVSGFAKTNC